MIDVNCNLISKQWFDYIGYFENGITMVRLNKKYNFIDTNGKLLSQQWFDWIDGFDRNGFSGVRLNNKFNFIDANGNLLFKQWFDSSFDAFCFMRKFLK